jgi:hypothetical protein
MEDIQLFKKITVWNPTGMTTEGRSKNKGRNRVINYLKKLKLRNWSHLFKDRKAWNYLVQKTKKRVGLQCQKERKEKRKFW